MSIGFIPVTRSSYGTQHDKFYFENVFSLT